MPTVRQTLPWLQKPPVAACQVAPVWAAQMAACWAMPEGVGNTSSNYLSPGTNDAVGSDATANMWTRGLFGPAAVFVAGNTNYFDCGAMPALSGASQATIFAQGSIAASGNGWSTGRLTTSNFRFGPVRYTDNNLYLCCDDGSGGVSPNVAYSTVGQVNICMVYDGTQGTNANRIKCYINGALKTLSASGTIPATIPTRADTWRIGHDAANNSHTGGNFDLVALWIGRALTAGEALTLSANCWQIFQPAQGAWLFPNTAVLGSTALDGWPYETLQEPSSKPVAQGWT